MNNPIKLVTGFITVGGWTLCSRIAGFIREIIFAALFGASATAEAFQIAFALPNMFRRFFAEGAFNFAFVPLFSKKFNQKDRPITFANDAFNALSTILLLLSFIAHFAMPWLILAMASGFSGDSRLNIAIDFGRICFPYILFISLAALFGAILNTTGRFAVAAAAPLFLNFILIGAMVAAYYLDSDIAQTLVLGVPIAGIVQLAILWIACDRIGIKLRPRWPRLTPDLKKLMVIAAPATLSGGVVQINLLIGRQVASQYEGAIQWLTIADRLYQLPLGVVGIAIGVVLLPNLSHEIKSDNQNNARNSFNRAVELSLFFTIPAAIAFAIIALPIVSVLFERGAFSHHDAIASAQALIIYAFGLPAFVLQKTLQPLYFARGNTKTPFYYALISMVVNAVIAIGLSAKIGFLAAAIATSVAAWFMIFLLYYGTRTMGISAQFDSRLKNHSIKILIAAIIMGCGLYILQYILLPYLYQENWRYLTFFILISTGGCLYMMLAIIFNIINKQKLIRILKK